MTRPTEPGSRNIVHPNPAAQATSPVTIVNNTSKPRQWPSYFLVRPTGEIVPMIAVDELPPGMSLIGVPRALRIEETGGMLNLGMRKKSFAYGYYEINNRSKERESKKSNSGSVKAARAEEVCESSSSNEDLDREDILSSTTQRVLDNSPVYTTTPKSSAILPMASVQTPQAMQIQLCRHWCIHGNCKWGQRCRYKHTMPMSIAGLHELGLRDWPTWYRNLNPGYFVDARAGISGANVPMRLGGRRPIDRRYGIDTGTTMEDVGEQTMRKLMKLEIETRKEQEMTENIKTEGELRRKLQREREERGKAIAVERSTRAAARRWEDDDSEDDSDEVDVQQKVNAAAAQKEAKLVDI